MQSHPLRRKIEPLFTRRMTDFTGCAEFRDPHCGCAVRTQYGAFVENVAPRI